MATLTSSLKLQDRFTRVMRAAYASTTKVIDAMERANATADKADLGRAYSEARRAIDAAEKELDQFEQGMKETDQKRERQAAAYPAGKGDYRSESGLAARAAALERADQQNGHVGRDNERERALGLDQRWAAHAKGTARRGAPSSQREPGRV